MPARGVFIRKAGREDLAGVLCIERESFPTPWSEAMYVAEFARGSSVFLAAEEEGSVIGYALAWTVLDEGHILKLAVAPSKRRQGLGRELMAALKQAVIAEDKFEEDWASDYHGLQINLFSSPNDAYKKLDLDKNTDWGKVVRKFNRD